LNKKSILSFTTLAIFFSSPMVTAETMYVNDNLEVMVRGGKGTEFKILAIRKAHEPVEVLHIEDDYSYVRLENGVEGWILKRYLTRDLPKPMVIANLKTEVEQVTAKHAALSEEYQKLKEQQQSMDTARVICEEKNKSLEQQYQDLKDSSTNVIQLREQFDTLQAENKKNNLVIAQLTEQNQQLRNNSTLLWFIAGAATLLIGLVIGIIIQQLRLKPRRSLRF
jgi:SH3 domain protein